MDNLNFQAIHQLRDLSWQRSISLVSWCLVYPFPTVPKKIAALKEHFQSCTLVILFCQEVKGIPLEHLITATSLYAGLQPPDSQPEW